MNRNRQPTTMTYEIRETRSIAFVLGALVGLRAAAAGAQEQGVDPLLLWRPSMRRS